MGRLRAISLARAILLACEASGVDPVEFASKARPLSEDEMKAAMEEARRRVGSALSNLPRRKE